MLKGVKELYLRELEKISFDAVYVDADDDQEYPVRIAQKNNTLGNVAESDFSFSSKVEFILGITHVDGFSVKYNDRLKIGNEEYSINGVEPVRIAADIVSYVIKVNS